MPAFFEIATPVSPPVKLKNRDPSLSNDRQGKGAYCGIEEINLGLPNAVHSRMHGKEVADLRSFPSDTANKAFGKSSQVEAMHHMKARNSTLEGNLQVQFSLSRS